MWLLAFDLEALRKEKADAESTIQGLWEEIKRLEALIDTNAKRVELLHQRFD